MSNIVSETGTKTDTEYMAEFEEVMAEIRQYEARFDKLQTEIEVMQQAAERKAARGDALQQEIDRQIKTIWESP